jgi:integrase
VSRRLAHVPPTFVLSQAFPASPSIDPLIAMKIVGHTDYQTTANIYTHIKEEMLKKAAVDLEGVFKKRAGME